MTPVGRHRTEERMDPSIIAATEALYRENPDGAHSDPTVSAKLTEGRAELSAGKHTWFADLPPAVGGTGVAPSPSVYLLGALAGCAVAFIHDTLGPQLGVRIDDVSAVARATADSRGLLGMDDVPADLGDIELEINVASPDGPEAIQRLEQVWLERCPIYLALAKPNLVTVHVASAERA
jgi:uncharacterized OsmC-like protein